MTLRDYNIGPNIIGHGKKNHGGRGRASLATVDNGDTDSVFVRVRADPVTNALIELFGCDATIQVAIDKLYCTGYGTVGNFRSNEMEIQHDQNYACEDTDFLKGKQGYGFNSSCLLDREATGVLTVAVTVNESGVSGEILSTVVIDKTQAYKKMLCEELGSDLVIIAENGKQVKSHKGVLLAHSAVFAAMFKSEMKEAKTHVLEMPDMSEEGVRGFLAYLYCGEIIEPNSKSEVAFEMLCAGHKYDIPELETVMKKLMLGKPDKWFNVDVAMKLFLLAKKLPEDGDRLKMKAVKVLKTNFGNFKNSPTYKNLFIEDPETAMEICEFAFGV